MNNTFGTVDDLRCGCTTDTIRIGHWCVCKTHGDPVFYEYAKERVVGNFIFNFTPDRRGVRPSPEDLAGLA